MAPLSWRCFVLGLAACLVGGCRTDLYPLTVPADAAADGAPDLRPGPTASDATVFPACAGPGTAGCRSWQEPFVKRERGGRSELSLASPVRLPVRHRRTRS